MISSRASVVMGNAELQTCSQSQGNLCVPGMVVLDLQGCHGGPNRERGIYLGGGTCPCDLASAKLNIAVLTGSFGSPRTFCWGNK